MFNWLQHKTGLFNIRNDLRELRTAFPHTAPVASQRLLLLIDNVRMEVGNPKFVDDVRRVIDEETRAASPALRIIAHNVLEIAIVAQRRDSAGIAHYGPLIDEQFRVATGVDLDSSKMTWLTWLGR